jgi:hypothetical protein
MKNYREILFDSSKLNGLIVMEYAINNKDFFKNLIPIIISEDGKYALRASYVLCLMSKEKPELIKPRITEIIDIISKVKDSGIKKNLLKIFASYIIVKNEEHLGLLVDMCFRFVMSPAESIATRVYSMEILQNATLIEPDLKNELKLVLEEIIMNSENGLLSRAKKTIKRL